MQRQEAAATYLLRFVVVCEAIVQNRETEQRVLIATLTRFAERTTRVEVVMEARERALELQMVQIIQVPAQRLV